jgi:glyoxylate reductase
MTKPRVLVTRVIPDAGLDEIRQTCEVVLWEEDAPPPREVILRDIAHVEGVLPLVTDKIDDEVMDAAPGLKVISNFAVGYDNIDVDAATERGIPVGNTPGVLTETSADLAFGLMLAAARRISESERYVRAGQWRTWGPMLFLGRDVHGATLGIIGLGRIGQAVARRARGFRMRILYHGGSDDRAAHELGAEPRSLDDLLRESDFVSLHPPLTPETYHIIDAQALSLMKPTAILVNTGRGGLVDPKALYEALRDGIIAYAALDVTEPEPILPDDPLLTLENCLIVPHIASASVATRNKMAEIAAANLLAGLRGERLPYCVNPAVYE